MALKAIIFLGSVRDNRLGGRVATFMLKKLQDSGYDATVFDPMETKFEMLKQPLHFYRDQNEAPQHLRELNEKIKNADAFVVVTPEYNSTIPPALVNMMDHFPPASYSFRPCAIVSYSPGSLGGARVAIALRPFLAELGAMALPNNMIIPQANKAIAEDGVPAQDEAGQRIQAKADKIIKHLDFYATAIKNQKEAVGGTFP